MEMHKESYSLDDIKKTYWKVFHESGEHFFHYGDEGGMEGLNNSSTEQGWEEFYQALERIKHAN